MIQIAPAKRTFSRLLIASGFGAILLISAVFAIMHFSSSANAIAVTGFKAGDIMSNAVMSNSSTMTESQIQSFLKSKNTCDRPVSGSGVTVYSNTRAYVKGTLNGQPATWWWNISGGANGHFLCMADDSFSGQSAAHVIYQAAQDYNINPQVLIVLLQKEQGLISDQWPNDHQYAAATGYDCPDTPSGCNNANSGFITQIRDAASLFHSVLNGGWSNYPVGDNVILYNPSTSCGSSHVTIANEATSALYRYTPYQPNSATISAGWPSPGVSCGAYGNLNFYMYFTQWFGSTHYAITGSILKYYSDNNGASILGDATEYMRSNGAGFYWQKFENGWIAGKADTGYYAIVGSIGSYYNNKGWAILGKPLASEQKDSTTGIWSQRFADGQIIGSGSAGYFAIRNGANTYFQKSGGIAKFGQPLAERTNLSTDAYSQQFQNGYIVGGEATNYFESTGPIRDYWLGHNASSGSLGLPQSNIIPLDNGIYQKYQGGAVVGGQDTGYYTVKGSIESTYLTDATTHFDYLGFPINDEKNVNGIYSQQFQNGYIAGGGGKYYRTTTPIYNYWISHGAQNDRLGMPTAPSVSTSAGESQNYMGGSIVGSETDGYFGVKGSIYNRYVSLGGLKSPLLNPTDTEKAVGNYWQQTFKNGVIIGGHGNYQAVINGPIFDRWSALGGATGSIGAPIEPQKEDASGVIWQRFEYGYIIMRSGNAKAWESKGSIRDYWAKTGYQDGTLGLPAGPETYNKDGSWSQIYEHGTIRTYHGVGTTV